MVTTAKRRSAARRAPERRRSAALSLAEAKGRRPDSAEYGNNNVSYAAGPGQVRQLLEIEYLWELRGWHAFRIYDQMRFGDPKIAGLRFAQTLPLLRAEVFIDPVDAKDKEAVAKAELVRRLLIDEYPWRSFVADTTLAEDYGFAPFEICWDTSSGEARCRLAFRPPSSIHTRDIYVIDGAIDHVIQRSRGGASATIPGEKLVWFCCNKEGDDFTGRPILRPMYKAWKLKCEQELQLAVNIGKAGGVPIFSIPDDLSQEERTNLEEAGENFGVSVGAYLIKPLDVEHDFVTGNANVRDILEAIKYWDSQLTEVAQAQVRDLGIGQVGSRALGTTMLDMFTDSIQAMASYREDVLNAPGGVVHQLVGNNFASDDLRPKLRFGSVQKADMLAVARALLALVQAGMTLDAESWDFVRAELNLPQNTVQAVVPSVPADMVPAQGPDPAADGGAQASETDARPHGLRLSELREPAGAERYLNLAELVGRFDDARTAIRVATQATRDALSAELARRATVAAAKGQLAKFAAGAPPMVDKLTAEIRTVLADFYDAGRGQVSAELARQRAGTPWTPDAVGDRIAAAETHLSPQRIAKDVALEQQAQMAARSLAAQSQAAAASAAGRQVAGVPVSEAAVDAAVARDSDAAALRLAGAASDLMQLGRTDEAAAQSADIEDAVVSALLDGATCTECESADGFTSTDLSEAEALAPNPDCEGGDRCRCLVVYEIAQDQGAAA